MRKAVHIFFLVAIPLITCAQQPADSLEAVTINTEDTTASKITRLKINSGKSDFSPYMINKQLFFVSGRNKNIGVQYVDANNGSEITDIYTCAMTEPSKFKSVNAFDPAINTKYYEGPFCFNQLGNIIYYTANDRETSLLKIYKSERRKNGWSKPELMPFCKPEFSYCHPALSPDENYLIFSANTDKQKKGMDLYLSRYTYGEWSAPEPLRAAINDSSNQVFPFINAANTLYFSSDKKGGMGGLDIYYVSLNTDSSRVRPLSPPVNSAFDDFGIWVDSTSESGYFSTNRVARNSDDIYYFTKSMPDFTDAKTVKAKTQFCFSFFEESTLESKDTVNLTYEWRFGDGIKGRGLKTRHCYAGPGEYPVELNIVDKVSGEVFVSQASYPLLIEKPDKLLIACLDSVSAGSEMSFSSAQCYLKNHTLSTVYWSFGDGRYNSGPVVKHTYTKPGVYTLEVGILAKNTVSGKTEPFKTEKKITVNRSYEK